MKRTTKLMRVPIEFSDTVERISKKQGLPRTKFLKSDGVRIFNNADALSNLFGGMFSKKRRK